MSAGRIIGRTACPLCDHGSAHVKQAEGKHPYLYCPECGCTLPTRNGVQASHLMRKTRADKLAHLAPGPDGVNEPQQPAALPAPPASPSPPAAPAADTTPPKPARRASPWAPLIGAIK